MPCSPLVAPVLVMCMCIVCVYCMRACVCVREIGRKREREK